MLLSIFNRVTRPAKSVTPDEVVIYCNPALVPTASVCDVQIDPTFAAALAERHFNPYLDNMKCPTIMQAFLRDYFNNPALVLAVIVEYKDWGTGLPSYMYKYF